METGDCRDSFFLIQDFFETMTCRFCKKGLRAQGIELLRQEEDVFVVNVSCVHCSKQMGVAVVGLDGSNIADAADASGMAETQDVEWTDADIGRFEKLAPIGLDDLLTTHLLLNGPELDWRQHLNRRIAECQTMPQRQSHTEPERL